MTSDPVIKDHDLIDRQAAIDAATRFRVIPGGELFEAIKRAIRRELEALPSAQQWTPCSERLPTKPGRYLATQKRSYGMYVTTAYFDGNEFFDEAVAWMPLPEPYKENKDASI